MKIVLIPYFMISLLSYSYRLTKANLWYMPSSPSVISARIRKARQSRGLTQAVLGERLRVTRGAIGHWEQGVTLPSTANLNALAAVLGVPLEWLVNGRSNPFSGPKISLKPNDFVGVAEPKGRYNEDQEHFDKETIAVARKFFRLPKKQRKVIRNLLDQLLPN